MKSPMPRKGFVASMLVVSIASGTGALSLAAFSAAAAYADSVYKKEMRVQAGLNANACEETARLIKIKDIRASGIVQFSAFGCSARL